MDQFFHCTSKKLLTLKNSKKYLSKLAFITLSHRFTDLSCECKNVVQTCPELTLFLPLSQFWGNKWPFSTPFFAKCIFYIGHVQGEKVSAQIFAFSPPKMTVFSNHLRAHYNNPSLGFTLAEPQTGIIVKSWFGVLSQSFPSSGWRKQSFWEGKRQKIELKLFLLGHDQYKRYILQKTGSKTAICVLRTGLNNLHPLI